MSHLLRDGDWMGLVSAAHAEASDDESWARSIARSARAVFSGAPIVNVIRHSPNCDSADCLVMTPNRLDPHSHRRAVSTFDVATFRGLYYPRSTVSTHLELTRTASHQVTTALAEWRRQLGVADMLGVFAYPDPGTIVMLLATHQREITLDRYGRDRLRRLALHLEAGYRLRHRPEVVRAVLDADGRVLKRAEGAPPAHVLMNLVRAREQHSGADALDLWPALVAGRLSLIQRGTGRMRRYLVVENMASSQPFRALSSAEGEVVSQASRGHSTKMISYALGIAPSSVSTRLASAAAKVGLSSRMDLVRIAAMLTRDPRARFTDIALSEAEHDVLELLRQGLSNAEIASMRSRSVRTIANQVSSLLKKTNSVSRRALVARHIEHPSMTSAAGTRERAAAGK